MLYKTQGIIIKRTNIGEFDRLLTVYTKDFGKILVRGKSIRKNQAKLKGHLELFLYTHLMIAPAKGFDIITGAETIKKFSFLHQNLISLSSVYYLSELIDKLIPGPEKDENIWQIFLSSLEKLNKPNKDVKIIISDFENKLLEFLGYGKQKNPLDFVEAFLREKLNSKYFLQETLYLLK